MIQHFELDRLVDWLFQIDYTNPIHIQYNIDQIVINGRVITVE